MSFDPKQFHDDVAIDRNKLSDAFANQASLFAAYAEYNFAAMSKEMRAKVTLDLIIANNDKRIREEAIAAGTKITEKVIEAELDRSPEVVKAKLAHNDAKGMAAFVHLSLDAFKQRRDMLIQLGADGREEMKGDLRMRAQTDAVGGKGEAAIETLRSLAK